MSLQQAIYSELSNTTAVTDEVGSDIYRGRAPTSAGDKYVVIHKISNDHIRHLDGGSGLSTARVQIDCTGSDGAECDATYDAVREALDNFRGTLGSAGAHQAEVRGTQLENDQEDWLEPTEASQQGPCQLSMDFLITYEESTIDNIS